MDDRRQRIFDATLTLVNERGLQSTPMSAIAKRSGVAMGTIYHHFASKEELVNALFAEIWTEMSEQVVLEYESSGTIRQRYVFLWTKLASYMCRQPSKIRFLEQLAYSPYISNEIKSGNTGVWEALHELYYDGQEQEIFKSMPIKHLLAVTQGALVALIQGELAGKYQLAPVEIDAVIDACWDATRR